jgi:hypothetical protein
MNKMFLLAKFFTQLKIATVIGLIIIVFESVFYFYLDGDKRFKANGLSVVGLSDINIASKPLDNIIGKGITLIDKNIQVSFIDFKDQLDVYFYEKRPTFKEEIRNLKIKLRESKQEKVVKFKEPVYLEVINDALSFAQKETKFFLIPQKEQNNKVFFKQIFDYDRNFISSQTPNSKEFVVEVLDDDFSDMAEVKNCYYFKQLSQSRFLGTDEYLQLFEKDKKESKKHRLFLKGDVDYCCYIDKNDLLIYKDGIWQQANNDDNLSTYPLARVRSLGSKILEIEGWEVNNQNKYCFVILPLDVSPIKKTTESLFTNIKQRTKSQITCRVDKKYMILRVGDWLVCKNNTWKIIKTPSLKKEVLKDSNISQFFVFSNIEERSNQKFFKGYLFNSLRTESLLIELPIAGVTKDHKTRIIKKEPIKRL